MTAEKTTSGIGEGGIASCSTECSSTTPHLGANDPNTNGEEENDGSGRNSIKRVSTTNNGTEDFLSSSSTVCRPYLVYVSITL